jgi:diguanylate cyclase (GGDEF)-like protein
MEQHASPSLHEKIMRLRRAYLAKLPRALTEARHGCALLAQAPTDDRIIETLHRGFHNIKGTTASLGLAKISAESAVATELVVQFRHLTPTIRKACLSRIIEDLNASITRLETLEVEAETAESENAPPKTEPAKSAVFRREEETRPRVVFYCDDDLDGIELGAQLSRFGYTFTSFTDAEDLKAAVLADPPDAVVISTAGADIMADLHRSVSVPALFVSKRTDFNARLKAVQAGGEAYFLKPVAAHDIVDVLDRVTTVHQPDPFRVLIVDDEPEVADYHAAILENAGMIPRRLDRPARILDELSEFQPDLVLMDMYMPDQSGRDLSRLIRQIPQFVSLPIIFLSSETDKKVQVSAMRVGADGFLTKPIVPEDLVTAVIVRAERTRVLRSLMTQDSLTGLLNHTSLAHFLASALATTQRNGGQLCFVMLDLDHFKKVNDTYGHPAGDQVLVALAQMLKRRLRNSDMVGRYGGEEFAIVLQDVSVDETIDILDHIRQDFAALTFTAGDTEFSCSFSGGVAGFPENAVVEQLVEAADQALYAAKRGGRNRVQAAPSGDRS